MVAVTFAHFRSPRFVVVLLTLALVAITAPRVFTAPLWGDELRTWRDGLDRPLMTLLTWQHNPDHAPLGHLLARGGAALFGVRHPWALRLGAWLCGLACVPMLWRLGRRVHSDAAGCLMGLMFVVDHTQVFQITQARMYPPMILASLVALTVAPTMLETDRRLWRHAVALGVAIGVGIWSHAQIYAVAIAVVVAAIVLIVAERRPATTRSIALLVAVLIGLGIGAQGVAKLIGNRDRAQVIDVNVTLEQPAEQLEDASKALTGHNVLTAIVVVCTVGGLVVVAGQRGPATAALLAATVVFAVVNLLVAARYRPVAQSRYLAIAQPPIWAAIAALLVELARAPSLRRGPALAVPLVAFTCFVGLCGFQLARTIESLPAHPLAGPFRDACAYVVSHRATGARAVVLPGSPLRTYARYYGLDADAELETALTKLTPRERRRATTTAPFQGEAELWLIGITPTTSRWRGTGDDPLVADAAAARARGQEPTTLPTTTDMGKREVIVVRYPAGGGAGERVPLAGRSSASTSGANDE